MKKDVIARLLGLASIGTSASRYAKLPIREIDWWSRFWTDIYGPGTFAEEFSHLCVPAPVPGFEVIVVHKKAFLSPDDFFAGVAKRLPNGLLLGDMCVAKREFSQCRFGHTFACIAEATERLTPSNGVVGKGMCVSPVIVRLLLGVLMYEKYKKILDTVGTTVCLEQVMLRDGGAYHNICVDSFGGATTIRLMPSLSNGKYGVRHVLYA